METSGTSAKPLQIWEAVIRFNDIRSQHTEAGQEGEMSLFKAAQTQIMRWLYLVLLHFLYQGNETGESRERFAVVPVCPETLPYGETYFLSECRGQNHDFEFGKLSFLHDKHCVCH